MSNCASRPGKRPLSHQVIELAATGQIRLAVVTPQGQFGSETLVRVFALFAPAA